MWRGFQRDVELGIVRRALGHIVKRTVRALSAPDDILQQHIHGRDTSCHRALSNLCRLATPLQAVTVGC
jgi:hypothetical protein